MKTSPGIGNIPWKFYLENIDILVPHFVNLFNLVLKTNVMPKDWKCALVTPLYKSKGSKQDRNNYRGISVLSPVVKLFEIVLSRQFNLYLSTNKFIVENQHGFREGFSCESALHELFNDLNLARDKKTLLLFVDFRKAFDMVDPELLLLKLKRYCLGSSALALLQNYFLCRTQIVKGGNTWSSACEIKLGVPQGSVLGPLFFSIFINHYL